MATKVVVELTSDEQKLLDGFRRATAADETLRAGMMQTGEAGKGAGAEIAKAMVDAGKKSAGSLTQLVNEMKRTGEAGRFVGKGVSESMAGVGTSGKRSIDEIIASMERLSPEAAEQARKSVSEWQAVDRASHFDAVLASLKNLGDAGARSAETITREMREADSQSRFDETIASLEALGPEGKEQAEQVRAAFAEAEKQANLDAVLVHLKNLGEAGKTSAAEIKRELSEADAQAQFDATMMSLEALGPEAQQQAAQVRKAFAEADKQSKLDRLIARLQAAGEEGKAVADRLRDDLSRAAGESAASMDEILGKIREIDPTAADAGERIRQEMGEAAEKSKAELDGLVAKLRETGPVGQEMARKLEADFERASNEAESDIGRIIARIRDIDPAVAGSAEKMRRQFEETEESGKGTFKNIATSAVTQLATVAGAYLGVQEAIASVNDYLREQQELLKESLDQQIALAKAQQEASKNLGSLTTEDRDYLLQTAVPNIASDTGFSDVAQITKALDQAVSRGANASQAEAAARQAARVEINTPDTIDDTAGAAFAIQNQVGLTDVRQAIGLVQTATSQAAVGNPEAMMKSMPKAIGSAVSTVRTQDPEEAARQAAALFAQVTQGGNDVMGDSSATFTTDLAVRMDKFFSEFDNVLMDARSKIQKIEEKKSPTESDNRDLAELKSFVAKGAETTSLQGTAAFDTLFGRIETLQKNPELSGQFLKESFGEQQFKPFLKDLFASDSSTAAKAVRSSFGSIQASPEFFEKQAQQIAAGTPQLAAANFANRSNAASTARATGDIEGGALASIRESTAKTLAETRFGGLSGFIGKYSGEMGVTSGKAPGGTAAEEAVGLLRMLDDRRAGFAAGGVSESEAPKVKQLETQMQAMQDLIATQAPYLEKGSLGSAAKRAREQSESFALSGNTEKFDYFEKLAEKFDALQKSVERSNEIQTEMLKTGQQTAANTVPKPPRPSEAQRAAVAASNNRGTQL